MALVYQALQRMSARAYGILVTLEPAIGALVGAVCLGQAIGLRLSLAVACVTIAALGVTLSERPGIDARAGRPANHIGGRLFLPTPADPT